jgi:hypothetical protein
LISGAAGDPTYDTKRQSGGLGRSGHHDAERDGECG